MGNQKDDTERTQRLSHFTIEQAPDAILWLELGDWLPKKDVRSEAFNTSTLEEVEKAHIIKVLESTRWRVSGEKGAAKVLGLNP